MAESERNIEKYRELYNLSKEVLNEEQNRFHRIDNKAAQYLSVVTLFVGVDAFFGNWIINNLLPPNTVWEWILLIHGVVLFAATIVAWYTIFRVFKVHKMAKIPLDSHVISFFEKYSLLTIYFALAKRNEETLRINREATDRKSERLVHGYRMIIASVVILILFLISYGCYKWSN